MIFPFPLLVMKWWSLFFVLQLNQNEKEVIEKTAANLWIKSWFKPPVELKKYITGNSESINHHRWKHGTDIKVKIKHL